MKTPPACSEGSPIAIYSLEALAEGALPSQVAALEPTREYILGRTRAADIYVGDEKASRRHLRLFFQSGALLTEDLGSVNGTRLNGVAINGTTALKDGDTIEIGRAKFRINVQLPVSTEGQTWWRTKKEVVDAATAPPKRSGNTDQWMTGTLKSVSLVDLIQLLSTSQKSAILSLKHKDAQGQLFLRDGLIVAATVNGRTSPQPVRNAYRLLCWKEGRFELKPLADLPDGPEIDASTSGLLLEGVQLADEMAELGSAVPGDKSSLKIAKPLPEKLRDLTPEELDLIQLILEHDTWLDVLDQFSGTDLEATRIYLNLLERKLVNAG